MLEEAQTEIERTLQLTRERGDRLWDFLALEQQAMIADFSGRWHDVVEIISGLLTTNNQMAGALSAGALCDRGEQALLNAVVDGLADTDVESLSTEYASLVRTARAAWARASGDPGAGLAEAQRAFDLMAVETGTTAVLALRELRLCARAAGDREILEAAVTRTEALPAGFSSPMLEAEAALGRAQLAPPERVEAAYARAVALHRGLATPFALAQALLGHGEALLAGGDATAAAPLLEEARELFAALGAAGWVQRALPAEPAPA
jgi:hypothetical protein